MYKQNNQSKEKRQVKTSYSQKMVKDIGTVDGGGDGVGLLFPLPFLFCQLKVGK